MTGANKAGATASPGRRYRSAILPGLFTWQSEERVVSSADDLFDHSQDLENCKLCRSDSDMDLYFQFINGLVVSAQLFGFRESILAACQTRLAPPHLRIPIFETR